VVTGRAKTRLCFQAFPLDDRVRQIRTVIGGDRTEVTGVIGSPDAGLTKTQRDWVQSRRRLRKAPV
jgi:hypothetical protein